MTDQPIDRSKDRTDRREFTISITIRYIVEGVDFKIFRTLAFLCFPSVSVCVHTTGR